MQEIVESRRLREIMKISYPDEGLALAPVELFCGVISIQLLSTLHVVRMHDLLINLTVPNFALPASRN